MELREVTGDHRVESVMSFSFAGVTVTTRKDEALGMVRITEVMLSCPRGEFTILESQPDAGGIWLSLKELPNGQRCSIFKGGPYKPRYYGLMFHRDDGHDTYGFVVDRPNVGLA